MRTIIAAVRGGVLAALGAILVLTLGAVTPLQAHAVGTPEQELKEHARNVAQMFDAHNRERRAHGLGALVFSPSISLGLSQPFTNTLARNGTTNLWHNSGTEMSRFGRFTGENVAVATRATGESMTQQWMNSSGHRANILRPEFTIMAVGFANADNGSHLHYGTVNFFASSEVAGRTYATGAEWLRSLDEPASSSPTVNVYLTPGTHHVNGRQWRTSCESYSQTLRCRTDIWGTQTRRVGNSWVSSNGWVFNNLTYAPSPRTLWTGNPLGGYGRVGGTARWSTDSHQWRTECDTSLTGAGGCRSFIVATVVESYRNARGGTSFRYVTKEVFNNMVLFS